MTTLPPDSFLAGGRGVLWPRSSHCKQTSSSSPSKMLLKQWPGTEKPGEEWACQTGVWAELHASREASSRVTQIYSLDSLLLPSCRRIYTQFLLQSGMALSAKGIFSVTPVTAMWQRAPHPETEKGVLNLETGRTTASSQQGRGSHSWSIIMMRI